VLQVVDLKDRPKYSCGVLDHDYCVFGMEGAREAVDGDGVIVDGLAVAGATPPGSVAVDLAIAAPA